MPDKQIKDSYDFYKTLTETDADGTEETPADKLAITYLFNFDDNSQNKEFKVVLDRDTLHFTPREPFSCSFWTRLEHQQCSVCRLTANKSPYCPIALNLSEIVEEFKDSLSHESVFVQVISKERTYSKQTTIQEGLSALIGVIMVTSGCPTMEKLKPMVRFHLPFATLDETIFRMASMYLVAQYLLNKKGKTPDMTLQGLDQIYEEVGKVNRGFAQRLNDAAKKDANVNALVNLHCFAEMVPMAVNDMLSDLEGYFSAYFE